MEYDACALSNPKCQAGQAAQGSANQKKCTHRDALLDEPNLEAQELVHLPHPLAVTARQVVIDRDHLQQERFQQGVVLQHSWPSLTPAAGRRTAGQCSQTCMCICSHVLQAQQAEGTSCCPSTQRQLLAVPAPDLQCCLCCILHRQELLQVALYKRPPRSCHRHALEADCMR